MNIHLPIPRLPYFAAVILGLAHYSLSPPWTTRGRLFNGNSDRVAANIFRFLNFNGAIVAGRQTKDVLAGCRKGKTKSNK